MIVILSNLKCLVQTQLNKRRRKRKGKKETKPTTEKYQRVLHILKTGQLADYTHPREVDPYWSKLYIQYEYLTYLLIGIEKEIEKERSKENPDYSYIKSLEEDVSIIRQKRKKLFNYMYNFMTILYGTVLKNRFYGWNKYNQEFTSMFTEQVIDNITRLRFNPDLSRPSIYFYQLFWLAGIGLARKIQKGTSIMVEQEQSTTNRGSKLFSTEDDYDEMMEDLLDRYETELVVEEPDQIFDDEDEENLTLQDVLHYLLYQAKISPDTIYNIANKQIQEIGNHIKKLLIQGKIKLPEKYQQLLKSYGIKLGEVRNGNKNQTT